MSSDANSPKLGGANRKGTAAPGLKTQYRAFRQWIIERLEEGDTESITALGSRTAPILIEIVGEASFTDGVRSFAAVTLGELRSEEAVPALAQVLAKEVARRDGMMLMLDVAEALTRIGTREARIAVENSGVRL